MNVLYAFISVAADVALDKHLGRELRGRASHSSGSSNRVFAQSVYVGVFKTVSSAVCVERTGTPALNLATGDLEAVET